MGLFVSDLSAGSMTKGTQANGKKHTKTNGRCIRCNRRAYHLQKQRCGSCGYPSAKMRKYGWSEKASRRRTYIKTLPRRFKNGFREGQLAKPNVSVPALV